MNFDPEVDTSLKATRPLLPTTPSGSLLTETFNVKSEETPDEFAEDDEFELKNPRDNAIASIVKKFKTHPKVERAIYNQRTNLSNNHRAYTDILSTYLSEAGSYALLDAADEIELFGLIEKGLVTYANVENIDSISKEQAEDLINLTAAQQVIFHTNLRLVINIAKPFWPRDLMPAMDLIQEGNAGLFTAISRFDSGRGLRFSTYGTWWVRQSITRAIGNQSRLIRLPVHRHSAYNKATSVVMKQSKEIGRYLTDEEIEEATGMDIKKYHKLRSEGMVHIPSLNAIVGDSDSDRELQDLVADRNNNVAEAMDAFADREELKQIMDRAKLKDREKFIIGLRYNLDPSIIGELSITIKGNTLTYSEVLANEALTLEAVGDLLGVTRERVRQIEKNGMEVLIRKVGGDATQQRLRA